LHEVGSSVTLAHLGLLTDLPRVAKARPPPQGELEFGL
jgi:hypothetical protein